MKLFYLVLAVLCVSVQSDVHHLRGEKEQKEPKVQNTEDTQDTQKPKEDTSHDEAPLKPLANNDEPAVGAKEADPVNKAPVAPGDAPSVPEPVGVPVPEVPEKAQDTPGDAAGVSEPVGIPVPEVPEKAQDTDLPKSEEEELDALGGDDGSEYEQYNFVSHPRGVGCRRWVNCRRGWYGNVRCNGGRHCVAWRWVSQWYRQFYRHVPACYGSLYSYLHANCHLWSTYVERIWLVIVILARVSLQYTDETSHPTSHACELHTMPVSKVRSIRSLLNREKGYSRAADDV